MLGRVNECLEVTGVNGWPVGPLQPEGDHTHVAQHAWQEPPFPLLSSVVTREECWRDGSAPQTFPVIEQVHSHPWSPQTSVATDRWGFPAAFRE